MFFPDATVEDVKWLNELQTVSAENAARLMQAFQSIDVRETATQVTAPTLVLHSTQDGCVPFEEGRLLAGHIPGARFVPLQSRNHIPLEHESAWAEFLDAVWTFIEVGADRPSAGPSLGRDIS